MPPAPSPQDFALFLNLVDFLTYFLSLAPHAFFTPWVYVYFKAVITGSNRNPAVSGFYKLLTVGVFVADSVKAFVYPGAEGVAPLAVAGLPGAGDNSHLYCTRLVSKFAVEVRGPSPLPCSCALTRTLHKHRTRTDAHVVLAHIHTFVLSFALPRNGSAAVPSRRCPFPPSGRVPSAAVQGGAVGVLCQVPAVPSHPPLWRGRRVPRPQRRPRRWCEPPSLSECKFICV